jgi:hypothetical protein
MPSGDSGIFLVIPILIRGFFSLRLSAHVFIRRCIKYIRQPKIQCFRKEARTSSSKNRGTAGPLFSAQPVPVGSRQFPARLSVGRFCVAAITSGRGGLDPPKSSQDTEECQILQIHLQQTNPYRLAFGRPQSPYEAPWCHSTTRYSKNYVKLVMDVFTSTLWFLPRSQSAAVERFPLLLGPASSKFIADHATWFKFRLKEDLDSFAEMIDKFVLFHKFF